MIWTAVDGTAAKPHFPLDYRHNMLKTLLHRALAPLNGKMEESSASDRHRTLPPFLQLGGSKQTLATVAIASLALASLPIAPAQALFRFNGNEYEFCAGQLLSVGITPQEAASACAAALHPRQLSRCVVRIDVGTPVVAADALTGCKRVRRPLDLASCVVDVDSDTLSVASLDALDYCRRSLLPLEFSECVIGLRREIDLEAIAAMDVCIAADDRALEYAPSFLLDTDPTLQFNPFELEQ